ncbi:pilus assembly FimT family protein [Deinococcus arenicola]|uniref:Type II secretion system protein n=1 Tax=Deinococcus arenicola TaxID=2994950 RepID=A0ABU4DQ81_9DEIO|nr:type II secretion system protein [Deinococcus sp. ZS9-10]MDV6374596.1 type II secretion system protein [Deinococcus sp. ZS9-10]
MNHRAVRGRTAGLTLIEILIVVAIIGILAGIFGISLIRSIRTAELREAAVQVSTDFQRARSLSQRGSANVVITVPKTAATTYTVNGQLRTLPNSVTMVCKTSCAGTSTVAVAYQAPYGELSAVGNVFTISSPVAGIAPFELRVMGVTGKIILTRGTP